MSAPVLCKDRKHVHTEYRVGDKLQIRLQLHIKVSTKKHLLQFKHLCLYLKEYDWSFLCMSFSSIGVCTCVNCNNASPNNKTLSELYEREPGHSDKANSDDDDGLNVMHCTSSRSLRMSSVSLWWVLMTSALPLAR